MFTLRPPQTSLPLHMQALLALFKGHPVDVVALAQDPDSLRAAANQFGVNAERLERILPRISALHDATPLRHTDVLRVASTETDPDNCVKLPTADFQPVLPRDTIPVYHTGLSVLVKDFLFDEEIMSLGSTEFKGETIPVNGLTKEEFQFLLEVMENEYFRYWPKDDVRQAIQDQMPLETGCLTLSFQDLNRRTYSFKFLQLNSPAQAHLDIQILQSRGFIVGQGEREFFPIFVERGLFSPDKNYQVSPLGIYKHAPKTFNLLVNHLIKHPLMLDQLSDKERFNFCLCLMHAGRRDFLESLGTQCEALEPFLDTLGFAKTRGVSPEIQKFRTASARSVQLAGYVCSNEDPEAYLTDVRVVQKFLAWLESRARSLTETSTPSDWEHQHATLKSDFFCINICCNDLSSRLGIERSQDQKFILVETADVAAALRDQWQSYQESRAAQSWWQENREIVINTLLAVKLNPEDFK